MFPSRPSQRSRPPASPYLHRGGLPRPSRLPSGRSWRSSHRVRAEFWKSVDTHSLLILSSLKWKAIYRIHKMLEIPLFGPGQEHCRKWMFMELREPSSDLTECTCPERCVILWKGCRQANPKSATLAQNYVELKATEKEWIQEKLCVLLLFA